MSLPDPPSPPLPLCVLLPAPRVRLPPQSGRTGGNRTPNPRFWRPVLCQLSYCPSSQLRPIHNPQLLGLLVPCVLAAVPAVLAQLEPLGRLLLVLRRAVVPPFALVARQRNDVAHL